MLSRLRHLYEAIGPLDVVQIAILAVLVFAGLRFLAKTGTGSSISRGLGQVVVGVFLLTQAVIASLDLPELSTVFDYLLMLSLLGLIILFQPELRRGLMMLGRTQMWQPWSPTRHAIADPLADAAVALARDGIGALIVLQRETNLATYADTGERIDGTLSAALLRTLFIPKSPLHDGAVILSGGRILAAGCQLPMRAAADRQAWSGERLSMGMRHRAALSLSEETDAIVLVVSEETGRISLACAGKFETVPREGVARRLVELLASHPALNLRAA